MVLIVYKTGTNYIVGFCSCSSHEPTKEEAFPNLINISEFHVDNIPSGFNVYEYRVNFDENGKPVGIIKVDVTENTINEVNEVLRSVGINI